MVNITAHTIKGREGESCRSQTAMTVLSVLLHSGQNMKWRHFCLTEHSKRSGNNIWWQERAELAARYGAKQYPRQTELTGSGLLGRKVAIVVPQEGRKAFDERRTCL